MLHVDTTTMQSMVLLTLTMEIADRKQDPTQAVCPNEDERNAKFAFVMTSSSKLTREAGGVFVLTMHHHKEKGTGTPSRRDSSRSLMHTSTPWSRATGPAL